MDRGRAHGLDLDPVGFRRSGGPGPGVRRSGRADSGPDRSGRRRVWRQGLDLAPRDLSRRGRPLAPPPGPDLSQPGRDVRGSRIPAGHGPGRDAGRRPGRDLGCDPARERQCRRHGRRLCRTREPRDPDDVPVPQHRDPRPDRSAEPAPADLHAGAPRRTRDDGAGNRHGRVGRTPRPRSGRTQAPELRRRRSHVRQAVFEQETPGVLSAGRGAVRLEPPFEGAGLDARRPDPDRVGHGQLPDVHVPVRRVGPDHDPAERDRPNRNRVS